MKKYICLLIAAFLIIFIGIISYDAPVKNEIIKPKTVTKTENIVENIIQEPTGPKLEYDFPIPEEFKDIPFDYVTKYNTEEAPPKGMFYFQEGNYNQFCTQKYSTEIEKYEKPITIQVALLKHLDFEGPIEDKVANQHINLTEPIQTFSLTGMLLVTSDTKRPKNIKVTINNAYTKKFTLNENDRVQIFDLDYTQKNVLKPISIKIEVLNSYPSKETDLYIEDIKFGIKTSIQ